MELKVNCGCGQKYKFDVEPVNDLMPFNVNCPSCGMDGTPSANTIIAAQHATTPPASGVSSWRINVPPPSAAIAAAPPVAPPVMAPPPRPAAMSAARALPQKSKWEHNMALGLTGAAVGAIIGAGLMYSFYVWAQFRMPYMGSAIGALSGLGARVAFRGTDSTLGLFTAIIALCGTLGALHFMYGDRAGIFIITMGVSAWVAWRIAR